MKRKTHVSKNGFLYKLKDTVKTVEALPINSEFHGYGRYVNPKGNYADAETVSLYFAPGVGYFALV
jgi:hypothetical protein